MFLVNQASSWKCGRYFFAILVTYSGLDHFYSALGVGAFSTFFQPMHNSENYVLRISYIPMLCIIQSDICPGDGWDTEWSNQFSTILNYSNAILSTRRVFLLLESEK